MALAMSSGVTILSIGQSLVKSGLILMTGRASDPLLLVLEEAIATAGGGRDRLKAQAQNVLFYMS